MIFLLVWQTISHIEIVRHLNTLSQERCHRLLFYLKIKLRWISPTLAAITLNVIMATPHKTEVHLLTSRLFKSNNKNEYSNQTLRIVAKWLPSRYLEVRVKLKKSIKIQSSKSLCKKCGVNAKQPLDKWFLHSLHVKVDKRKKYPATLRSFRICSQV